VPVDALSVAFRALSFIALFQAAGMAIFIALYGRDLSISEPALRKIGTSSALAALVLVAGHYSLEAARMSGELSGAMDPALQSMVMHSATSTALILRLVGITLLVIAFRMHGLRGIAFTLAGAAAALISFTFVGHTVDHSPRWLLRLLLLAHLLAAAFWFGALLPLYLVSSREAAALAGKIVARFSALAIGIVPGLLLAGLCLAVILLPNLAALGTPYGRMLVLKMIGFSLLMVLASLNKWRLGPALAQGEQRAAKAFRRSLVAEYLLIAAVLSVTAALTTFYSPEG
jgi:putative copper resistance protein D